MRPQTPFAFAVAVVLATAGMTAEAAADGPIKPVAVAVRLAPDGPGAALVFDLSRAVEAHAFTLASPDRIVVDLPDIVFQIPPDAGRDTAAEGAGLVKAFRFGQLAPGKSRLILDLASRACPVGVGSKPIAAGLSPSRLTIEIRACDDAAFAAAAMPREAAAPPSGEAPDSGRPVVVLDPGHGGIDGGARGVNGSVEKTLVLDFCVELKRQLQAGGLYTVLMTREGDTYVDLDSRVAFARDANAALFVSIHADTLNEAGDVSGSTVYTVADRASDAEAARIAARENAADRDPGKPKATGADPAVADILFDLKRRETRAYSHLFSRRLVDGLKGATRLNHNPERSAGFVVLKAPEFPSVLVELGYLSNVQDVAALTSADWRARTAAAMVKAIDAFLAAPGGGVEGVSEDRGVAYRVEQPAPPGH
ncbi:N-acetylmuramoyl-L-alanine amidase [Roseiarcus fermentans]|uniref:N-acetylmuramoyl-L-alanine amidase n=1 Tax=Roseiarcus fermentans TaxID=1473586 RepID=A0A366EKZ3_9HYPH|nr:N-acetylmuramoyl-L-alanine amidase [Roseiarcus fermentans]RBP03061.1 N-acetylmuramoyl-L-alanine amidase [Roseiarcus fermentans]